MSRSTRWLTLTLLLLFVIALIWSLGARGLAVLPAPCRARFPFFQGEQDATRELGISLTPPVFPEIGSGQKITVFVDGSATAIITPESITSITPVTLTVPGRSITGWVLQDVLVQALADTALAAKTRVTIGSSNTNRAVQFSWSELQAYDRPIILARPADDSWLLAFPLSPGQSTDAWVQEVDRIKISRE